jgi:hypothetical protein
MIDKETTMTITIESDALPISAASLTPKIELPVGRRAIVRSQEEVQDLLRLTRLALRNLSSIKDREAQINGFLFAYYVSCAVWSGIGIEPDNVAMYTTALIGDALYDDPLHFREESAPDEAANGPQSF